MYNFFYHQVWVSSEFFIFRDLLQVYSMVIYRDFDTAYGTGNFFSRIFPWFLPLACRKTWIHRNPFYFFLLCLFILIPFFIFVSVPSFLILICIYLIPYFLVMLLFLTLTNILPMLLLLLGIKAYPWELTSSRSCLLEFTEKNTTEPSFSPTLLFHWSLATFDSFWGTWEGLEKDATIFHSFILYHLFICLSSLFLLCTHQSILSLRHSCTASFLIFFFFV